MENSLLLAKFLGCYLTVAGIGVLLNPKNYQQVALKYSQNEGLIYFGGILALSFGLLIILFHNIWAFSWVVIITLFGWLGLLKGIRLIIFPTSIQKLVERYYSGGTRLITVFALIILVLGVFLMFKGFSGI